MTSLVPKVLEPNEGLRLQSGPGRDLVFKVTGEDTGGALDYFVVEVAPRGGPPLHVHPSKRRRFTSFGASTRSGSAKRHSTAAKAASPTCHRASRTHSSTRPTTRARSSWSTPPAAATGSTKN